jgi:UDP-glucose 4-epimerase
MERNMRVLVTGGSGYIGSHTCVQLLQNGHDVIILDNLCNSKRSVLPVIERLGGKQPTFVEGDIRNEALMTEILHDHAIEAVIHFAGLKAVGESVAKPLEYYDNNVNGTLRLSPPCVRRTSKTLSSARPPPSTAISQKSLTLKASRPVRRKARMAKAS